MAGTRPGSGADSGALVVIGNFDGVHRGHQAVLAHADAEARSRDLRPVALTFEPHPLQVLTGTAPPRLCTLERKVELIGRVSPALRVVVERFDAQLANLSPEDFARSVLVELAARYTLVGQNFRFGRDRAGDLAELARLGDKLGFEARAHELCGDAQGAWSSSRVREALARGDLADATSVLGRPHMLSGTVVEGDRRGRTIGFPTCNLGDVGEALPGHGVYAVLVDQIEGDVARRLARGVANVGVRPTVDPAARRTSVEVHLFDLDRDLYGARLRVHLATRLRPEQTFPDLPALRAQIARDAEAARAALFPHSPDADSGAAWY